MLHCQWIKCLRANTVLGAAYMHKTPFGQCTYVGLHGAAKPNMEVMVQQCC